MNPTKPFYQSKTFWASIVTAVLPLIPPVGVFVAANPQAYSAILAVIFGVLRVSTSKPVALK